MLFLVANILYFISSTKESQEKNFLLILHGSILYLTQSYSILQSVILLSNSLLTFIFLVCKVSIKEFKSTRSYFSLLTLFVTMGFVGRSFVDGNMRDHVFLQFMLILGISLFFLFQEKINAHKQ